ncbi:MAG: hypothetical protein WC483_01615 [Candidatus Paceibacterota bacterium]
MHMRISSFLPARRWYAFLKKMNGTAFMSAFPALTPSGAFPKS